MQRDIHTEARGRWHSILTSLGIDEKYLVNTHGPCPMCSGIDRFRFDDKEGKGTFFCSKCGAGSGMDLLMGVKGLDFKDAVRMVREILPKTSYQKEKSQRTPEKTREKLNAIWRASKPITETCESGTYLRSRGFDVKDFDSSALRTHPGLEYFDDQRKLIGSFPAMIAMISDINGRPTALHRTYLKDGKKAKVDKPKKTLGKLNPACAIRLQPTNGILGVGEGIETSMASSRIFKIPFWPLISAGQMEKFEWPKSVKKMVICGDNDLSFTGQKSAYTLAYRAAAKGLDVEVIIPEQAGSDMADKKW